MLLFGVGFLSLLVLSLEAKGGEQQSDPIYCYDCHYDPDTEKEASFSYQGGYPGYPKCAMDGTVDSNSIDKWPCNSGKCFIRRDPNGLLYRGCADPWNLPWGVDDSLNCEYQGQKPSLWWFCDGSKCNGGSFASSDICGESQGLPQEGNDDDAYEETVHGTEESYPGDNEGYAGGKSYKQPDHYGKDIGYSQNNNEKSYSHTEESYETPVSEVYEEEDSKDSGYAPKSNHYGNSNSKKGKEGENGVDVYGIYTAEVAPMYPKKSMYHMPYNHWRMPYNYYYGKKDFSYGKSTKNSFGDDYSKSYPQKQPKLVDSPKQNSYKSIDPINKPSYKSIDPHKQPSYKSVDQPKQPSYKSVDPPKQPNYKSVEQQKQPSYKSVHQPKQPSYKSVDPPKQPSYKSVDPTKQPSYKSYDPPKKSGYKSVDPPKQPSYKSVEQPKQPSYKAVDPHKQSSYKSDPPKKPSYESVNPHKQPSYKSVNQPKQPSYKSVEQPSYKSHDPPKKSGYTQPNQKSVKSAPQKSVPAPKSYKSFIPPVMPVYKSFIPHGKSTPQSGKKGYGQYTLQESADKGGYESPTQKDYSKHKEDFPKKPISQPIDYVHGLYQKEQAEKAAEYESFYNNQYAGIYDTKTGYEDQMNSGYANTEIDEVYKPDEPYYQQQPVYNADPKPGNDASYEENSSNQYQETYEQPNDLYDSANPCDGKCHRNPSGLFSHPEKSDWFIQCGNGMDAGKTCSCCKPYYLKCPYGTTFDGVTRVCSKMSGASYGGDSEEPKYKQIDY